MRVAVGALAIACVFFSLSDGSATKDRAAVPNASIARVVMMFDNLLAEMEAEQAKDDKQYEEFSSWCVRQQEATQSSIEELQALIEELEAKLAKLYSQKQELEVRIAELNHQIQETQQQIQIATEKRNEEHQSFGTEQQNFDASIAACGRAVEILKQHYGEPAQAAERPAWMSLLQQTTTIRRTAIQRGMTLQPEMDAFLQEPQGLGLGLLEKDRYQASTGDASSIVVQMQALASTFSADKQSSIDEENRLQEMYGKLMKEKTALLNTLIEERDSRQTVLNKVNQDIAQNEGAKAAAEAELEDDQAYLSQVKKSCSDAKSLYAMRREDRSQESLAVNEAKKVLAPQVQGTSLLELSATTRRSFLSMRRRCKNCERAASFLATKARALSSEVLATAAAAAMQNDALQDIIGALDSLVGRLKEDQKMEDEHKDWCETELSETTMKKGHHEMLVDMLTQTIADLTETIAEKVQALQENAAAVQLADKNFEEATAIRESDKDAFETELKNYVEALSALNQAIDILAKFYASKKSLLQTDDTATADGAPREMAPGVFQNVYESKGGRGVIDMISTVRAEFEQGKKDMEAAEKQAVADFGQAREDYLKMRRDLVSQGDKLTVEKQTAEAEMEQAHEDKASNQQEVEAAKQYLLQLGGSCNTLIKNYDSRKQQRGEEEDAIKTAKKVLEEEA